VATWLKSLSLAHSHSLNTIKIPFNLEAFLWMNNFYLKMHLQFYFHLVFMKMHKRLYSQHPMLVTEILDVCRYSPNCCCQNGGRILTLLYIWAFNETGSTNCKGLTAFQFYHKQICNDDQLNYQALGGISC